MKSLLTSRNKNQDVPIPMCGVPHRAADTYIARLIEKGCKVAVCGAGGRPGFIQRPCQTGSCKGNHPWNDSQ